MGFDPDPEECARLAALEPERLLIFCDEEADLADPNLYARDPAAFAKLSAALESARQELSASEEEWLELEERREALAR